MKLGTYVAAAAELDDPSLIPNRPERRRLQGPQVRTRTGQCPFERYGRSALGRRLDRRLATSARDRRYPTDQSRGIPPGSGGRNRGRPGTNGSAGIGSMNIGRSGRIWLSLRIGGSNRPGPRGSGLWTFSGPSSLERRADRLGLQPEIDRPAPARERLGGQGVAGPGRLEPEGGPRVLLAEVGDRLAGPVELGPGPGRSAPGRSSRRNRRSGVSARSSSASSEASAAE